MDEARISGQSQRADGGELPRVEPPTVSFIVQLFFVPFLIIAGVVTVFVLFGKIAAGNQTPERYIRDLTSSNWQRRWNAARDLNLKLEQDKSLRDRELLAKAIIQILDTELGRTPPEEDTDAARFLQYLTMALSRFTTPQADDAVRKALNSDLPASVRAAGAMSLGRLAEATGEVDPESVHALVNAARDPEVEVRKIVAFALGSLDDPTADQALSRLLNDDDREVRYNAALSLTKNGRTRGLDQIHDMLDLDGLQQAGFSGRQLETIPLAAIQALLSGFEHQPEPDRGIQARLEWLADHGGIGVRPQAKNLLLSWEARI